jgi:hypothetical protein
MQSFLIVLLEETTKTIGELGENITTRITKFREFMSRDQRMGSAGSDRVEFYGRVVERAGVVRWDLVSFNIFLLIVFKAVV